MEESFTLVRPEYQSTNVVFASAHSGRYYPDDFVQRSILDTNAIRSSEDAFVDRLFSSATRFGAPFLMANYPRAYVDLNRSADELDPALISGLKSTGSNPRIASGLGVVPRVVSNGRAIYNGKLDIDEVRNRLAAVWHPYHDTLDRLLRETRDRFGSAVLIDCHSMPREAIESLSHYGGNGPDIVLGDRFGASASNDIVDRLEAGFAAAGLVVARNSPFAGAYTTQHYGRPSRGQHVVQVEIDRSLYMNEATVELTDGYAELKAVVTQVVSEICRAGRPPIELAAE